jgi:hypothetical protein
MPTRKLRLGWKNTSQMIQFTKMCSTLYRVNTPNGHLVGEILRDVDGYFYFWPEVPGSWSLNMTLEIARKLYELNKEWDQHIQEILNNRSDS